MYYYIIPFTAVTPDMIEAAIVDSIDTLRHNIIPPATTDEVVIKTPLSDPAFSGHTPINETEIYITLAGPEWAKSIYPP